MKHAYIRDSHRFALPTVILKVKDPFNIFSILQAVMVRMVFGFPCTPKGSSILAATSTKNWHMAMVSLDWESIKRSVLHCPPVSNRVKQSQGVSLPRQDAECESHLPT